jgi:hypothetical protein
VTNRLFYPHRLDKSETGTRRKPDWGVAMNRMTKISIAVACALGMSAAVAQTVQRG